MAPPPRSNLDADDLLMNGFFKTSRGRQTAPSPTPTSFSMPVSLTEPAVHHARLPSRSHKAPRWNWPPKPHVEDEKDSLIREFGEAYVTALGLHDPPCRGVIDQLPIFYESEFSASDSTNSEPTRPSSGSAYKRGENSERRFVLIPKSDTHSPVRDEDVRRHKKLPERPRAPVVVPVEERPRHHKESRDSPPPITRRRSRQDLPALTTNLAPQPPPFRRSTSAYSYKLGFEEPDRTIRSPSANAFLYPDSSVGKGGLNGRIDFAAHSLPRKYGGSAPKPSSPISDRKPGIGESSQPPTPSQDRSHGSVDSRARSRGDPVEIRIRSQQLADENSSRRPERPRSRLNRHDSYERHHSRQLSAQSSKQGYTSSDLDDSDASDKRRRRHHRHSSRHADSLCPDVSTGRHRRTASNRSNIDFGAPKKTFSMPLPIPRTGGAGPLAAPSLSAGLLDSQRKDTYPPVFENTGSASRPVSPFSAYDDNRDSQTNSQSALARAREPSPTSIDPLSNDPKAPLPMPIPMAGQGRGDARFPSPHGEWNHSTGTSPTTRDYWQPPPFQPPIQRPHLKAPNMGCVRRFSEDNNDGTIGPLLPCPRIYPIRGKADWLTLPKCPDFNICPSCYQSAIEPTSYSTFFVPAPFRSLDDEVSCDFGSQPWYRIAWLLLQKTRANDLTLIHQIAHVSATTPPCLGGHEAVRKWHSIRDPDSGRLVQNFDVCHACAQVVEALLPPTRGLFVPSIHDGAQAPKRTCDLRFDTPRFLHYFDSLELSRTGPQASGREPDTRAFVALAKRFAAVSPCRKDKEIFDSKWYSIAQLPELAVCGACFEEVIRPEVERYRAIAAMFALGREVPVGSCGMYSSRMREAFKEAVVRDDYRLLARVARERREREGVYRWEVEEARTLKGRAREERIEALETEWRRWE